MNCAEERPAIERNDQRFFRGLKTTKSARAAYELVMIMVGVPADKAFAAVDLVTSRGRFRGPE